MSTRISAFIESVSWLIVGLLASAAFVGAILIVIAFLDMIGKWSGE